MLSCASCEDKIVIVLASDDKFAMLAGICVVSIMENLKSKRGISFYLIDGGINPKNKAKLLEVKERYNIDFNFLEINLFEYEELLNIPQFSRAAYYRFDAPHILSEYPKILYLDCDIILNTCVSELFDTDISKNIVAVAGDTEGFFNSGVMLIDTKKWIEHNIKERCVDLIKKKMVSDPEFLNLPDQNTLIAIFKEIPNSRYLLSYDWNVREWETSRYYTFEGNKELPLKVRNAIRNPKLIHYTHLPKPTSYRFTYKRPFKWFFKFQKYKSKTPWKSVKTKEVNLKTVLVSLLMGLKRFVVEKFSFSTPLFVNVLRLRLLLKNLKGKSVYCYGAGKYASELFRDFPAPKLPVQGFIDSDISKKGTKLFGYEVFHTSDAKDLRCDAVVLTLVNPKRHLGAIKETLNLDTRYYLP